MVRSGGYRNSAQKAGKSAGQRKRRMARDRKQKNREMNVYPISIHSSVLSKAGCDDGPMFGIYKEDGKWVLTGMAVRRTREKLVSDRRGATESKVCDRRLVRKNQDGYYNPRHGIKLKTFDKKKQAMNSIRANSSTRVSSGEYVVHQSESGKTMDTYKVGRDKFRRFQQHRMTYKVRD